MLPESASPCSAPPSRDTRRHPPRRRGASLLEVVTCGTLAALGIVLAVPALAGVRGPAMVDQSLDNLRALGLADAAYAAEWNGRQWTAVNDTLAAFGTDAGSGFGLYNDLMGGQPVTAHPPITLGWGYLDEFDPLVLFAFRTNFNIANARLCEPIVFSGTNFPISGFFGSFRVVNDARFTPYLGGRFFEPTFFPPADTVVHPFVEPLFAEPCEFVYSPSFSGGVIWGGYIRSAAAMFDPAVMTARRQTNRGPIGGWVEPWSLDTAFRSPTLAQARYPALKTSILEHHWLQHAPEDPCNPAIENGTFDGCEPWYFNHGVASTPATLFFDGSTRLLPNAEVMASDSIVQQANGGTDFDGLWSRSTAFGQDGYFGEVSFDQPDVSHHVLTADGILGRDTLAIDPFDAPRSGGGPKSASRSLLNAAAALLNRRWAPLSADRLDDAITIDPRPSDP